MTLTNVCTCIKNHPNKYFLRYAWRNMTHLYHTNANIHSPTMPLKRLCAAAQNVNPGHALNLSRVLSLFNSLHRSPCSGCDGMALSLACSAAVTAALKALISALIVLRFAAFATPPPTHVHTYTTRKDLSPTARQAQNRPPPPPGPAHHRRKSYRTINHQPFGPIPQLSPMRA